MGEHNGRRIRVTGYQRGPLYVRCHTVANFWGHKWARQAFNVWPEDEGDIGRLAFRLWSERNFDAWIGQLDEQLKAIREADTCPEHEPGRLCCASTGI